MRMEEYTDLHEVYLRHKKENPNLPPIDIEKWVRQNAPNCRRSFFNSSFFLYEGKIYGSPNTLMSFYNYLKVKAQNGEG